MKPGTVCTISALLGFVVIMTMAAGCLSSAGESVCGNMGPGETRDHCYQNVARQTGDVSLCNEIEGAGPASKCYLYLAPNDPGLCKEMTRQPFYGKSGAYREEQCWQYVAVQTRLGDYCSRIPAGYDSGASDMTPGGVSTARCFRNLGCGLAGQSPCRTTETAEKDLYICYLPDKDAIFLYPKSAMAVFECPANDPYL